MSLDRSAVATLVWKWRPDFQNDAGVMAVYNQQGAAAAARYVTWWNPSGWRGTIGCTGGLSGCIAPYDMGSGWGPGTRAGFREEHQLIGDWEPIVDQMMINEALRLANVADPAWFVSALPYFQPIGTENPQLSHAPGELPATAPAPTAPAPTAPSPAPTPGVTPAPPEADDTGPVIGGSTVGKITDWIKANPVPAVAIGAAGVYLLTQGGSRRRF